MRRAGNHAIIQWLSCHYPSPVWFVNNIENFSCPAVRDENREESGMYRFRKYLNPHGVDGFWEMPKDVLIHSYEDIDLQDLNFSMNDSVVGEAEKTFNVLVIRDSYNMFASRFERHSPEAMMCSPDTMELWKQHAREALGLTKFIPNLVVIRYNHWFRDWNYRRALEDQMGFECTDDGMNEIGGPGSSFDEKRFNGKATWMRVLERWEQVDDILYRVLFDRETILLTNWLFGEGPKSLIFLIESIR